MKRKCVLATTLAAAMLLGLATPAAYAEEAENTYDVVVVQINDDTFPDKNFQECVRNSFDGDHDGNLSFLEIYNADIMTVGGKSIASLKGIEYFKYLTNLYCAENPSISFDLSQNTALKTLNCQKCQLTSLDVSKNTALTELACNANQLTSLDVSKNTALTVLNCNTNQLTSLDLSNNTALNELWCYDNQLTSLNVSKNKALTKLSCQNNQLTSLDLSNCTNLATLSCARNPLGSLDLSNNTALDSLDCDGDQLTSLDVSNNTALTHLECGSNQLTGLDVSSNKALKSLSCLTNQLTNLDVSNNTALTYLDCRENQLTSLDISQNTALDGLRCDYNQLTSLDVSNNTALTDLECIKNQLTSLDVSKNTALTVLRCSHNQLTSLDVSNNTALTELWCRVNQLSTLNLENIKGLGDRNYITPQEIENAGTADIAALVGQANLDRVSDIKTLNNGVEYYYDTKGICADGTALPKMKVTVEVGTSATTPTATPEPTTPANPDDSNTGTGDNDDNTNNGTDATPSTEGTTGFVDRLYSVCLGRPADAAGQADWVKQLTSYQISGTKAAFGFIFSQEFTNMNYSNADYVEHLYEAFMGRASDEGGKADWVGKLDAGTSREEVFNGFANSVEFDNICKSYGIVSKDIETFVTRLYSVCLDRQPDDAGLADWANQLRSQTISGKAAASGFVFSEEFTSKNYSNADYVEHLYAAFMGRASDEGGKADWVSKLDAGTTREEVFNGFANSAEFDNICASYGIVRG